MFCYANATLSVQPEAFFCEHECYLYSSRPTQANWPEYLRACGLQLVPENVQDLVALGLSACWQWANLEAIYSGPGSIMHALCSGDTFVLRHQQPHTSAPLVWGHVPLGDKDRGSGSGCMCHHIA